MWVAGWVAVAFCWKFDLQWVGLGCRGFVGWVVMVVVSLSSNWGVSGCGFFLQFGEISSIYGGNLS